MKTEYAVQVYNKYHNFVEQIYVFETYEEAEEYIKNANIDLDCDSEYFDITEIEYYDNENETGITRMGE